MIPNKNINKYLEYYKNCHTLGSSVVTFLAFLPSCVPPYQTRTPSGLLWWELDSPGEGWWRNKNSPELPPGGNEPLRNEMNGRNVLELNHHLDDRPDRAELLVFVFLTISPSKL